MCQFHAQRAKLILQQSKRRRTSQQSKAIKDDSDSELSDVPLKARVLPKASAEQIGESADSDVPLAAKLTKKKESIEKAAAKEAKFTIASRSKFAGTPMTAAFCLVAIRRRCKSDIFARAFSINGLKLTIPA